MKTVAFTALLFLLLGAALPGPARAAWSNDPTVNTPVCTAAGYQLAPVIAGDGTGGAIIAWTDQRNGAGLSDIYAQRLDVDGNELWAGNGIAVCHTPLTNTGWPRVLEDGAGGAFIAWIDGRSGNSDIYLQRVDSSGAALWTANGIAVCTQTDTQESIQLMSDEAGGVIVAWTDLRAAGEEDFYAQRVDGSGNTLWATDGAPICTTPGIQYNPWSISDGAGGIVTAWRGDAPLGDDIHIQRLDDSGAPVWAAGGIALCTANRWQGSPRLVSDGAGGYICCWADARIGYSQAYVQRVTPSGNTLWVENGVRVSGFGNGGYSPIITGDGEGGAIISWIDEPSSTWDDIYAQRIDALGHTLWPDGGKPVCDEPGHQWTTAQIADGTGGAFFTYRDDVGYYGEFGLGGQRIDPDGDRTWVTQGQSLATVPNVQGLSCLAANGAGGIILAWSDPRNDFGDIYAQQVTFDGVLGGTNPTVNARLTCVPDSGVLPLTTLMSGTLNNLYTGQTRRIAAVINVEIASGSSFSSWRAGYTNVAAGGSFINSWNQNIPALGSLVGLNTFTLQAEDVTPAPYNQPPYPEAGCTDSSSCTIEGFVE